MFTVIQMKLEWFPTKNVLLLGVFVIIIIKISTFTTVGFQMDAWNEASCYRGDLFIVSVAKRKHFNEIIMCMHHHGQQMNWSWDFWVWGFVVLPDGLFQRWPRAFAELQYQAAAFQGP